MKLLSSLLFITTAGVIGIYAQEYEIPNHQLRGELDNSSSTSTSSTNNNNNDTILKERAKSAFSYTEDIGPGLKLDMALHTVHHSTLSEYQSIQVIDTYFGRTLVTDGKTQSAAHDEYVYHESLVHPPLFWSGILGTSSGNNNGEASRKGTPKSVFIGGGGELATAREVLKHNTVERVVMVDLDPVVIEVSKQYLPNWGGEAVANHPKMELIIGDSYKYLMETDETFDVIIMDISDPIEAGPGIALYTQEFYQRVAKVLTPNSGVFVTQAGSGAYINHPTPEGETEVSCLPPIMNTLTTVFDHAIPYTVPVASFGEDWGFVMAFNGSKSQAQQLIDLAPEEINTLIEERIESVDGVPEHGSSSTRAKKGEHALELYDGESHRGLFALSKPLRRSIQSDERIMTLENPIFMY